MARAAVVIEISLGKEDPKQLPVIQGLIYHQTRKVQELLNYFKHTPCDLQPNLVGYFEIAKVYFKLLFALTEFRKNAYMKQGFLTKTKDAETFIFENSILAHTIFDMKNWFTQACTSYKYDPQLIDCCRHGLAFYTQNGLMHELSEAVSLYENLKGDFEGKAKFASITIDTILGRAFSQEPEDILEKQLADQAQITPQQPSF